MTNESNFVRFPSGKERESHNKHKFHAGTRKRTMWSFTTPAEHTRMDDMEQKGPLRLETNTYGGRCAVKVRQKK